ncbi:MAG TPA: DMT family transporter, partial [Bacillota bacterium]|nr:DMT family transporter [Bacillota bacterium]
MTNNPHRKAIIFLICTALLWSLGGLLIKSISWHPLAIAGSRSLIAAALMFAYRRKFTFTWSIAQIGGAVAYAATVILFVSANKMTTAANAILLQYTAPIYVALFGSWFLNEKTDFRGWLTIGVTLGGMGLFFLDHLSAGNFWGNVLAICSGLSFAGVALFLRKQKDGSTIESLFLGNILTAIIGFPFILQGFPGGSGWLGLIVLGVFQLGLSYILYGEAVKHVTALEAILIPIIEPLLNPIWVFLLLHETPGEWALVGGGVVLVAVTFWCVQG